MTDLRPVDPHDQNPFADSARAMDRAPSIARAFVLDLPRRSIGRPASPETMSAALDEPLPEEPGDPAETVAEWFERAGAGVVASAGPRFFGYVAVADLCARTPGGAWLHVDGAFGLIAAASPALRPRLAGIDRADSVAGDGHTWMNLPYDSGFAFVRDTGALRAAFDNWATTSADVAVLQDVVCEVGDQPRR